MARSTWVNCDTHRTHKKRTAAISWIAAALPKEEQRACPSLCFANRADQLRLQLARSGDAPSFYKIGASCRRHRLQKQIRE